MATPVAVTQFETKSHKSPDEVRTPDKTRVEIVRLEGFTFAVSPSSQDGAGRNASNPSLRPRRVNFRMSDTPFQGA